MCFYGQNESGDETVQCIFDFFMTAPSKTHTFETIFRQMPKKVCPRGDSLITKKASFFEKGLSQVGIR
jgi:hypothetical protein